MNFISIVLGIKLFGFSTSMTYHRGSLQIIIQSLLLRTKLKLIDGLMHLTIDFFHSLNVNGTYIGEICFELIFSKNSHHIAKCIYIVMGSHLINISYKYLINISGDLDPSALKQFSQMVPN
jgi:hypothetical protein